MELERQCPLPLRQAASEYVRPSLWLCNQTGMGMRPSWQQATQHLSGLATSTATNVQHSTLFLLRTPAHLS